MDSMPTPIASTRPAASAKMSVRRERGRTVPGRSRKISLSMRRRLTAEISSSDRFRKRGKAEVHKANVRWQCGQLVR